MNDFLYNLWLAECQKASCNEWMNVLKIVFTDVGVALKFIVFQKKFVVRKVY